MALLLLTTTSALAFTTGEVIQILIFAFAAGGLWFQVRTNSKTIETNKQEAEKRVEAIEDYFEQRLAQQEHRVERLETRTVGAIDKLGDNIKELAVDIKSVLAGHEQRLVYIEEERRHAPRTE